MPTVALGSVGDTLRRQSASPPVGAGYPTKAQAHSRAARALDGAVLSSADSYKSGSRSMAKFNLNGKPSRSTSTRPRRSSGRCATRCSSPAPSSAAAWRCAAPAPCCSTATRSDPCVTPGRGGRGPAHHDHRGGRRLTASARRVQDGMDPARRAAMRLLPERPAHECDGAAASQRKRRTTPTSTPRWPATSAAAAPMRAFAPRSTTPRRPSPEEATMSYSKLMQRVAEGRGQRPGGAGWRGAISSSSRSARASRSAWRRWPAGRRAAARRRLPG